MEAALPESEGTWEEIAERAPEFAGRRLHVTVLPANLPEMDSRLPVLAEIEERSRNRNPRVGDRDRLQEGRNCGFGVL
jgi:hypothetical protein